MSGGSMDYLCWKIEEYADDLEDKELIELANDFAKLCKDCEWYHSGDINKGTYRETILWFKEKWFNQSNRDERLIKYAEQLKKEYLEIIGIYDKCADCKNYIIDEHDYYGKCSLHTGCLFHRLENCEDFSKAKGE